MLGRYCAAKHAVVGLTESLDRELAGTGVGVHVLCPNLVRTQIFRSERNRDDVHEMTPAQAELTGKVREVLQAMGIGADEVAGDVLDAILHDRPWVFAHDLTLGCARKRLADMRAGASPSNPYAQVAELEELQDGFRLARSGSPTRGA
jgi:NAD(P)-dependent dehydrogenase (short-subunit alcohol dehydrogenase family)